MTALALSIRHALQVKIVAPVLRVASGTGHFAGCRHWWWRKKSGQLLPRCMGSIRHVISMLSTFHYRRTNAVRMGGVFTEFLMTVEASVAIAEFVFLTEGTGQ